MHYLMKAFKAKLMCCADKCKAHIKQGRKIKKREIRRNLAIEL